MVRLKIERLRRGMSQQELGYKARVQASEISKMECGVLRPYPAQRARLARVLGIAEGTLMEEVDAGSAEVLRRTAAVGVH